MQAVMDREASVETDRFWQLFEEHHRMVLRSAFRVTGNMEDAEDALQTVFMRMVNPDRLEDLGVRAAGYLHRAAVNAALDIVRSRKTARRIPLESVEEELPPHAGPRPDELESAAELRSWLRRELGRLNPRAAEILVLKALEGYSNREIAQLLETSPGSVAVTLHRTRNQLQQSIASLLGGRS